VIEFCLVSFEALDDAAAGGGDTETDS